MHDPPISELKATHTEGAIQSRLNTGRPKVI